MIDIIIPTLLQSDEEIFNYSLIEANKSPVVNKIFIIDNTGKSIFKSQLQKVEVLYMDKNIYVNPAWNLGVSLSKSENVLIMNDDIACRSENYEYIEKLLDLKDCGLCSISSININCLKEYTDTKFSLKYIQTNEVFSNPDNNKTGWFFALKRKLWKNIPAPIKIIYGDDLIFSRVRKLGYHPQNIMNLSIGHLGSKTINNIMDEILLQINKDITEYHNYKTFYLEEDNNENI